MQGSKKQPATATSRRDDRAEPDDEGSSPRVDVVNVDGPGSGVGVGVGGNGPSRNEGAASGMTSLKAQLAKLNEQAAAVEKSLDDQRRDRSDALEQLDRATEHAIHLEAQLATLEAETASLRTMVEASTAATAELAELEAENEALHRRVAESMRDAATFEGEIADLRKRRFQEALKVTEQETLLGALRTKLEGAAADVAVAREEATLAREATAKAENTITLVRGEASKARDEAAKARDELAKARDEAAKARDEAAKARDEAAKARDELETVRQELARAKEDNAKDRATARDRIDGVERALEAAVARATDAEARATAASTSQATLEQNMRRLREDIAGAFARIAHGVAAPPPLPAGARPETREAALRSRAHEVPQSISPEMLSSVAPSGRPAAAPMPAIPSNRPLSLELDDSDWSPPESVRPPSARPPSARPPSARPSSASPASKSVPPPPSVGAAVDTERRPSSPPGSIPPPTYASVPPQVHASAAPLEASEEVTRDELFVRLDDPDHGAAAARELKEHPEWLRSVPPMTLIRALQSIDYDVDRAVLDLARQWEREPLCQALVGSLRAEPEARLREHAAWLLKHLAAPASWRAIADLARSDGEGIQLRRWLLEALDRLAAGRAIGWRELGEVVTTLAKHPDASMRDGVVGILVSLDRSDEKRRLLLEILRTDDDETVLASAVNALAGALPMELDPGLVERLLGHPSPRVQRSVRELIERAKQTKP